MALFQASELPWASAVEQIADAANASGDDQMRQRAHRSLRACFQYLNSYRGTTWEFLLTHHTPLVISGPAFLSISATGGASGMVLPANHGLLVDDLLIGSGIFAGARISSASGVSATANVDFSSDVDGGGQVLEVTAQRDLYAGPSDFRKPYWAGLLGAQRTLKFTRQRLFGRVTPNVNQRDSVFAYNISQVAGKGKLGLFYFPEDADVLDLWYYRRMYIGSASGDETALDILEDFEYVPLAWAKWHFLNDKKEERGGQGATWFELAQDGLQTMLAENVRQPDEDLGFLPGWVSPVSHGDNSTAHLFSR